MTMDSAWFTLKEVRRRVILTDFKKKDIYNKKELLSYLLANLSKEYDQMISVLDIQLNLSI